MDNHQKELLSKIINSVCPVSSLSLLQIIENCNIISLPRFRNLTKVATNNNAEYFLLDGILHRYNIDNNGEEVTTGFYLPMTVITPNFARTVRGKSTFFLQALTDVILAEINVSDMNDLRNKFDDIRTWGYKVVEDELSKNFEKEINFRSKNAKERLNLLRKEYPNLENLVPHTCIASYLGITPVSFSRLRNELSKRK